MFSVQAAEDESTFSVVDNTRTRPTRGFGGRGGSAVFRGRGAGRGAPGARGGPQARGTFQRVGRGGQQQQQYDNQRGGGRGRGGRRFGWKDYDKPQRNRDASVNVRADWHLLEEIDFARLSKLNLEAGTGEELASHGFLHAYDRALDKQPGTKVAERRLNVLDRAAYNVTTSSDPVIQDLASQDAAQVFATDNILSMLMCTPRSVYSWDLILERRGNKIFTSKSIAVWREILSETGDEHPHRKPISQMNKAYTDWLPTRLLANDATAGIITVSAAKVHSRRSTPSGVDCHTQMIPSQKVAMRRSKA